MAINLASKFSPKVDERIKIKAYTGKNLNNDYEFTGVKTISVYSIDTVALNAYSRTGSSRYGTPTDLGDTKKDYVIQQDIAFTFVIDKGNNLQQLNIKDASKALKRETDEVIVPYLDKFRFATFVENVQSGFSDTTAISKTNVYEKILAGKEKMAEIGAEASTIYVTPAVYNYLKLDANFIKASDTAQKMLVKDQMGEVDGTAVIMVKGKRLPAGVDFLIVANRIMIAPTQLNDYKIHKDPPGINGQLVEGRMIHDAFILESRKKCIYVQGTLASAISFANATGYKTVASGVDVYGGEKVYYKVASSAITASTIGSAFTATGYTEVSNVACAPLSVEVTGTSTNKYAEVVVVGRNGNVRDAKAVTLEA